MAERLGRAGTLGIYQPHDVIREDRDDGAIVLRARAALGRVAERTTDWLEHWAEVTPDAVFLAVPATPALTIIRQLADMNAGGVVCYTAGFSADGSHGPQADREVIQAAGSMALVGPNCYGLINYIDRVALWPFAHDFVCTNLHSCSNREWRRYDTTRNSTRSI